jgi:hypothetical protein
VLIKWDRIGDWVRCDTTRWNVIGLGWVGLGLLKIVSSKTLVY